MQAGKPPPEQIPDEMYSAYTLGGAIPVHHWYFNDARAEAQPIVWTKDLVDQLIEKARLKNTSYYGATDTYLYSALEQINVQGRDVAIIGSVTPWYEAICLAYGARPISIDYNPIVSQHPAISTLTQAEYQAAPRQFDMLLSISSIEHDGLGRYGDTLKPDGDRQAMQSARQMLKRGGRFILAVPVGKDALIWNAHRIYGAIRLPLLLQGWQVVDSYGYEPNRLSADEGIWGGYQPVFVLAAE